MIREYFRMALRSVLTHKMRSILTTLGVIIGVFSVILLVSLGNSAKEEAASQIRSLGSNLVLVSVNDKYGYLPDIWLDELKETAQVAEYSNVIQGSAQYSINGKQFSATVYGVNENFGRITSLDLEKGRFIKGIDVENSSAIAVIGQKVADSFFGGADPIGKTINVKGIPFRVVGLLTVQGTSFNGDMDKVIYIPSQFASSFTGQNTRSLYYVESKSESSIDITKQKIEDYLKQKLPSANSGTVFSQSQMLSALDTIMGLLTALLAGIAAISLIVGGIGIMNIMLVTVRERTKEIGIRKALGARRANILFQFLVEAVIITLLGGLIGLLISMVSAVIISSAIGFSVTVGFDAVVMALSFSTTIGVIFGIYPAAKASKLEPVEALRFE